ncbi:MAG TPA: hypothetical protein VG711_10810 [Phycisphaerales bacterium]|nr:hypothetical protein [Phycisphaerales bacterium]
MWECDGNHKFCDECAAYTIGHRIASGILLGGGVVPCPHCDEAGRFIGRIDSTHNESTDCDTDEKSSNDSDDDYSSDSSYSSSDYSETTPLAAAGLAIWLATSCSAFLGIIAAMGGYNQPNGATFKTGFWFGMRWLVPIFLLIAAAIWVWGKIEDFVMDKVIPVVAIVVIAFILVSICLNRCSGP